MSSAANFDTEIIICSFVGGGVINLIHGACSHCNSFYCFLLLRAALPTDLQINLLLLLRAWFSISFTVTTLSRELLFRAPLLFFCHGLHCKGHQDCLSSPSVIPCHGSPFLPLMVPAAPGLQGHIYYFNLHPRAVSSSCSQLVLCSEFCVVHYFSLSLLVRTC